MIEPVRIEPNHLFDDSALYQTFGLSQTALAAARRNGSLRFVRHGHRILYLGSWVLSWLEASAVAAGPKDGQ
jgi:hypothetical protein